MKRNKKSIQESYNMIMKQLSKDVKHLIEQYSDDDLDEIGYIDYADVDECDETDECCESRTRRRSLRSMNEMARSAVKRTINPKSLANVRDAASRRGFDVDWAIDAKPSPKFDDIELLHRYVAALLVYKQPCPKTEEEIDEIGIFKNYAHKLIDEGTGTLDDIQTLYAEQDRIGDRQRRGTTRAIKGWKKAEQQPSEDFNFDEEEPTPAPVNDEPDYPAYDESEPETSIENEPDYPAYDEPETEPETSIEDDSDYPAYDEVDSESENAVIKEITNIQALTEEDFNDPAMNASFNEFNNRYIKLNGRKIGFDITIKNDDESEEKTITIWGDSFGDVLRKLNIITMAGISSSGEFFTIESNNVINEFRKRYVRTLSDDVRDTIDDEAEDLKVKAFDSAKNIDDIISEIEEYAG